jgi:kinesin family member 20
MKMKAVSKSPRKSSFAPQAEIEKRPFIPDPPMLPSDTEDAELTETELDDQESVLPSSATESELGGDDDDDDDAYSDSDEHEDDDWSTKTPKAKQSRSIVPVSPSVDHAQHKGRSQAGPKSSTNQFRDAKLTKYMDNLNLEDGAANDSTKKAYHESLDVDDDDDEEFDLPVVKKKKRSVFILRGQLLH